MSLEPLCTAAAWDGVRLVVFDVDGTLYRQRSLRLRMALELLSHAARSGELATLRILSSYRHIRERLSEEEAADFQHPLIAQTARSCGTSEDQVRSTVAEWIDRRPLRHLAGCRYPGVIELFAGLRHRGKSIGILSDYHATEKLEALGLAADHIVCAEDEGIGILKPNAKGLIALITAARAMPETTVLIGDRPERDGQAARRIGARAMIRSSRSIPGWQTFRRFDDVQFAPLLDFRE